MRYLTWLTGIAILLSSCHTAEFIQHTPALVNSGMHTDKDQFTGRALYSTGSSTSSSFENSNVASPYQQVRGVQAQGSFAADDHLAVQGAFMHSAEKGGSTQNGAKTIVYNYNRNVAEAGLAYFHSLGTESNFYFELGTGAGMGTYKATENPSVAVPGGRFYNHNVIKFYLQPLAYFVSPNIHMQIGFRFSVVNFNQIKSDYTQSERQFRDLPAGPKLSTTVVDYFFRTDIFPPGAEWIGLTTQLQLSTDLQKKYFSNMNDNNYGIGIIFRLSSSPKSKGK
jgi:hypothetical protein